MSTDQFFQVLESCWMPLPPGIQESFLGQTKEFIAIENRLKEDQSLASYDQQIYPELRAVLGMPSTDELSPPRAVLHFCNNQLQLMENVFLALNLAQYHSHPLNRGWMNLFRRWTAAHTMRLLWPSLKSLYSKGFVAFAEYQLNLSGMPIVPKKAPEAQSSRLPHLIALRNPEEKAAALDLPSYERLFKELGQEWPKDSSKENYALYFEPFEQAVRVDRETDVEKMPVIWTVSHPETEAKEIWGVALLAFHPKDSNLQRLMIWVRPAYRGIGLGTKLLDAVIPLGKEREEQFHNLIVVLPPLRRDKPGYGEEMAGWLRFYSRKGFVRTTHKDAERILGQSFDPEAFCLVMPELLERFRGPVRKGDSSP